MVRCNRMRIHLLAASAALTFAAAAFPTRADNADVQRVLSGAGLMGSWAVDCSATPGETEYEDIVSDARGGVQSLEGGHEYQSNYDIVEAERVGDHDVRMRMIPLPLDDEQPPAGPIVVVYRVEGDQQMTWSSVTAAGEVLIAEGQFAGSEQHSQWYHRCPASLAPDEPPFHDTPGAP
jgi:hypothetical protein